MKLKCQINIIINLKIFLIIFTFALSNKTFSNEKNFVIATVDRSPITYFDLKQKAKLIHFMKTKNNVSTCVDCGCKIKVSKIGKDKSKCVSKRCKSCLFKAMSHVENDNILDTEPQIQKDIKII